ncbi:MAG: lactonase family protein [Gemmatimonadota bacterium]
MKVNTLRFSTIAALALSAACSDVSRTPLPLDPALDLSPAGGHGQVYTQTNSPSGNSILVYDRASNGSLTAAGSFATGGTGTGGGLGNQGAVILHLSNTHLLAVNAGSNEVSSFRVNEDGSLRLINTVPSGGTTPVSVTGYLRTVYVLNAGGTGNITGFRLSSSGALSMIAGSSRPLSGTSAGAAQIQFARRGRVLIVTEKATNNISNYTVGAGGLATGPIVTPSNGATPFGFAVHGSGLAVISEAFGGAPDASALSSWEVNASGAMELISGSVGTTETAACWVVITENGRYAYTTNTGSGSISGYRLSGGALSMLDADGVTATSPGGPIDMALTRGSGFLYVLNGAGNTILGWSVNADGSLSPVSGGVSGLPAGTNGLAAN